MADFQQLGEFKRQELILPPKPPSLRLGSSGKAAPAPKPSVREDKAVTRTGMSLTQEGAWDLDSEQKPTFGAREV